MPRIKVTRQVEEVGYIEDAMCCSKCVHCLKDWNVTGKCKCKYWDVETERDNRCQKYTIFIGDTKDDKNL